MATYLPGITDFIPQIQPFKPDFNTYNNILQIKQAQTDIGRKRIGSMYASLLYAPLTGEDNIKKRDDYFKMIEQNIKKISAMDLSLPQNQSAAMKVFDPILDDKDLIHDMTWTKQANDQYDIGESFRRCTDPKECGGEFWEEGLSYINLKRQEFKNATPEERRAMGAPRYNPFVNITQKAFEWTKEQGLIAESVTTDGRYIVTKQNGEQMLVPLTMIYNALYGRDPKVRAMFDTSAYLTRKNYIEQNKDRFGGDEKKAEDQWFLDIMKGTVPKQLETLKEVEEIDNFARNKKDYLGRKLNEKSVTQRVKDDDLWAEYQDVSDDAEISGMVKANYDNLASLAKTLNIDLDNREMLRQKIDNITAAGLMQQELFKTAGLYAMTHNAITGIKADQYGVQAQAHSLAMQRLKAKADLDLRNAFLTESGGMSDKLYNLFNMGADGPIAEAKILDPLQSNITAEFGKPGAADRLAAATGAMVTGANKRDDARKGTLAMMQSHLNQIISTGSPDSAYAKSVLKKIFGAAYDDKSNKFVKGGLAVNDFTELDLSNVDLAKFYGNAMTALSGEKTLFKSLRSNQSFNKNLAVEQEMNILSQAGVKALEKNAGVIYKAMNLQTDLGIEDKIAFKRLFKEYDNGKIMLKPKSEYIREAAASMRSGSEQVRMEAAAKDFDEQMAVYKMIYNSGRVRGLVNPFFGTSRVDRADGGMQGPRIAYTSDPRFPFSPGTRGMLSIFDNMKKQGSINKVLFGTNHQTVGEFPNELSYNDLMDNSEAKRMLSFLERDMRNGVYKRGDKDVPYAELTMSEIGANRSDLNMVHIAPNYEWLKSYAKADKTTGVLKAFGKPIDQLASEGVTVYLNSSATNNLLFNQLKKSPYDMLIETGDPIPVNFKNASSITIQKTGDKTSLSGEIWGYDKDADGKIVRSNIKTFQNLAWPQNSISGGTLYKAVFDMANDLNTQNMNFIEYGVPSEGGQPIENYIMGAMQATGRLNPTPEQLMISNFQQNFASRMRIADAIMRTMSQY